MPSLMCVGLESWIEDINRAQRLSKRGLLLPDYVSWGIIGLLLNLKLNLKISSSWISSLLAFMLDLHQQLSRGSSACQLQVWGLLSLHNCMSQLLIINLSLCLSVSVCLCTYTQTHILLVLFVWRTLINIGSLKICLYLHYKIVPK